MDKVEARELLDEELRRLRGMPYAELRRYLDEEHLVVTGASGKEYQIEITGIWDTGKEGDLHIVVSIDDGGFLAALRPMTGGFLLSPEGTFVGEQANQ